MVWIEPPPYNMPRHPKNKEADTLIARIEHITRILREYKPVDRKIPMPQNVRQWIRTPT